MCFSEGFIELFTAYDHVAFEETEEAIAKASIEALANRYRSLLGGVGFVKALREKRGGEGQGSASARWCRPRRARRRHLGHRRTGGHRRQFDEPQRTRLRLEAILVETPDGWASPTSRRT